MKIKNVISIISAAAIMTAFSATAFAEVGDILTIEDEDSAAAIFGETTDPTITTDNDSIEILIIEDENSAAALYGNITSPTLAIADDPGVLTIEDEEAAAADGLLISPGPDSQMPTGDISSLPVALSVMLAAVTTGTVMMLIGKKKTK